MLVVTVDPGNKQQNKRSWCRSAARPNKRTTALLLVSVQTHSFPREFNWSWNHLNLLSELSFVILMMMMMLQLCRYFNVTYFNFTSSSTIREKAGRSTRREVGGVEKRGACRPRRSRLPRGNCPSNGKVVPHLHNHYRGDRKSLWETINVVLRTLKKTKRQKKRLQVS